MPVHAQAARRPVRPWSATRGVVAAPQELVLLLGSIARRCGAIVSGCTAPTRKMSSINGGNGAGQQSSSLYPLPLNFVVACRPHANHMSITCQSHVNHTPIAGQPGPSESRKIQSLGCQDYFSVCSRLQESRLNGFGITDRDSFSAPVRHFRVPKLWKSFGKAWEKLWKSFGKALKKLCKSFAKALQKLSSRGHLGTPYPALRGPVCVTRSPKKLKIHPPRFVHWAHLSN